MDSRKTLEVACTEVVNLISKAITQRQKSADFESDVSNLFGFFRLITNPVLLTAKPSGNPCEPSPCGPNSICRVSSGHAVCSCQPSFVGSPPSCRPECVSSGECPQHQACISQKCRDPCPGTCGFEARCQVVNHNPICSCPPRYDGDPFVRCTPERKSIK